jgi:hypothetical protein
MEFDDTLTYGAKEVVVLRRKKRVKALMPSLFIESPCADQSLLLQPTQCAVNRRQVKVAVPLVGGLIQFFGGRVAL